MPVRVPQFGLPLLPAAEDWVLGYWDLGLEGTVWVRGRERTPEREEIGERQLGVEVHHGTCGTPAHGGNLLLDLAWGGRQNTSDITIKGRKRTISRYRIRSPKKACHIILQRSKTH